MCGISFYCIINDHLKDELQESLTRTKHRGPDSSGTYYHKILSYHLGLGHNRLSILDLSETGMQPMDLGLGAVISYNGEIYNHSELRTVLENKGYAFKGRSDTEVILLLYIEFGAAAFSMIRGMFAFVIIDERKNNIFIVRDRLGIKPIYIYQNDKDLYACSEIRGLKAFSKVNVEIDRTDIFEFFNNGFLYEPSTGYTYIKKLLPGHYLEFDLSIGNGKIKSLQPIEQYATSGLLSEKIKSAIHLQIAADVPVGTFFSGGCDSSIIASYVDNTNLLFAKYHSDPSADIDVEFSREISTYLKKTMEITQIDSTNESVEDLLTSVDFVAGNTEELISDYTFWSTYQLSVAAKNQGYKVMLSGMGGDEVFAGYPRYIILKNHRLIKMLSPILKLAFKLKLFPKKLDKKFERLVSYSSEKHWPTAYSRLLGYFSQSDLKDMFVDANKLRQDYQRKLDSITNLYTGKRGDKIKLAQHFDVTGFLAHNLMVSDKASMLASIELRVPFLDEAVVAYGVSLPAKELLKKGELKQPLKALLSTLLPKKLVTRPKTGFNPPLDGLINKIGSKQLKVEFSCLDQYIRTDTVNNILDQHFSGLANNTYKLWQLLYFSRWLQLHSNI